MGAANATPPIVNWKGVPVVTLTWKIAAESGEKALKLKPIIDKKINFRVSGI
jgi:hypothetical protein